VSSTHLGPKIRFLFTVSQLRVCWSGAPSLTIGRICRLQLLLVLASAVILESESSGSHSHILLSQIWDFPSLEGQVPIFISPRNRLTQLYPPGTGFHFRRLLRLAGLKVEVFEPASTRESLVNKKSNSKSKLLYHWWFTASQSWLQASGDPRPETFFNWTLAVIVLKYQPLWRENGFVSYEYVWPFF
jgi:hypothetical protein